MTTLRHIPEEVLNRHLAVLAMNGAGKSYAVRGTMVEPFLAAGKRLCIIDPTGVHWGVRLDAKGHGASKLDVVIFGGQHADFPISEGQLPEGIGAAIADVIATSSRATIIDTSDMTVGDRTRFFTAFAETLLRKNRAPLHLVIDEAHLFAPQGRVADPQSGRMLHAANNLISLGRSRGLRVVLITQRPAKLHKDSLTQAHSLILMKLVAPQDRDAAKAWIEGQPDRARGDEIMTSLAGLQVGHGWLWAPEIAVLAPIAFPEIATFDSFRAPDDTERTLLLPKLDTADIEAKLAEVAATVAANDPGTLKKRIADLEAKLKFVGDSHVDAANAAAQQYAAGEQAALATLDAAANKAYHLGYDQAFAMGVATITDLWSEVLAIVSPIQQAVEQLTRWYEHHFDSVDGRSSKELGVPTLFDAPAEQWQRLDHHAFPSGSSGGHAVSSTTTAVPTLPPKQPTPGRAAPDQSRRHGIALDKVLSPAQLRILDALAWLESIGVMQAPREIAAFLAKASPRSSAFLNNVSSLRTAGLLDYAARALTLTAQGRKHAERPQAPLTHGAMMAHVLARLQPAQGRVLQAVTAAYPNPIPREIAANRAGASPTSSAFSNNVSRLKTLGLISYQPHGMLRAEDRLYP